MNGRKFFVFSKYSILKSRYEADLVFCADKYELDDNLKAKSIVVPEGRYEEIKNR